MQSVTAYLEGLIAQIPKPSRERSARLVAERHAESQQRYTDSRARALRSSGVAGHIRDEWFNRIVAEDLPHNDYLHQVRAWRQQTGRPWLLLCGTVGTGKTVAAASVLAECGGMFIPGPDLARIFAARWGAGMLDEQREIRRCRLLVIDDIGGPGEDAAEMTATLLRVLDARQSMSTLTVITTNLSVASMLNRYGDERLRSRLHQSVHGFEFQGPDLRWAK